jgi:pilus assembly protein Flp/PilA
MQEHIRQAVWNFVQREDGPTAVEYAVMLSLIIVACIFSVTALGTNTNKTFTKVSTALSSAS